MQVSSDHIIRLVIITTIIFLVGACFLLMYVGLYNRRKRKHTEEKKLMKKTFDEELIKTQMEVQEQTLQTIAADIHDNVGQLLSLTKITLSTVNIDTDPEKAKQKVENASSLVGNSIKELRQLAAILHAENILAGGLEQAIGNELSRIARTERFKIIHESSGEVKKIREAKKELIAFRLIQELLNNILKHSDATIIQIHFQYNDTALKIKLEDNGKGFDVTASRRNPVGLGLHNLFKRAQLIGGELELTSESNHGTCALLSVPY